MDDETLRELAEQLGADTEDVLSRWQGRPDNIIDDIFRVRDIDTGDVRDLELFDVQRRVVHAYFYGDAGTLNIYKGRRIGYSFIICACYLLEGVFYPDSFYPLVSRSLSQAKNRIDDIQSLIDHAKVEIPTVKNNTDYIELWNGSAFQAYSADSDTSRGDESARSVLMDEMAFIEDEKKASRAFGAFLALGQNRKMAQVSTPNTRNDLFMQEHRRGSPQGQNGVISIKQPTFENAEEIDIKRPLYEQEVIPVRPDINIDRLETERMSDPEGFGQEYLCRPVIDAYRFFDEDTLRLAQKKAQDENYRIGIDTPAQPGWRRIMGIDIAAGVEGGDDTVISVADHHNDKRKQRFLQVVTDDALARAGVRHPDPGNPVDVAELISHVYHKMGVDAAILDKGGVGEGFKNTIERRLGRTVVGFDFSATDEVNTMFGDMNICLRQEDAVLVPDDRLFDEMAAIVKEKKEDYSRPRYSGKDESESGKDDTAMATVLSFFPPKISTSPVTTPATAEMADDDRRLTKKEENRAEIEVAHGTTKTKRSSRSRRDDYSKRHARHR